MLDGDVGICGHEGFKFLVYDDSFALVDSAIDFVSEGFVVGKLNCFHLRQQVLLM